MNRRVMFLHYLLSRNENELIVKFFHAQILKPAKDDWCTAVKKDLNDLNMSMNFEEIKTTKKLKFKKMLKIKIEEAAFSELINSKGKKLKNVTYNKFKLQPYLKNIKISPDLAKTIFKFRTRMSNVKINFKSKYSENDLLCPLEGCDEIEDDNHLIKCKIIDGKRK